MIQPSLCLPHRHGRLRPVRGWRIVLWLLLAMLAVAPLLGGMHAVLHPAGTGVHAASVSVSTSASHGAAPQVPHGIERLFGDHAQAGDCRLFDQLCHADGVTLSAVAVPAAMPPAWLRAWWWAEASVRQAALFDARGPPVLR